MGDNGRLVARNCLVWGNGSSFGGNEIACMWSNCLLEGSGGSVAWNEEFQTDGGGNIDADPGFLEPLDYREAPSLSGDFRIGLTSPAAGAGDRLLTDSTEDFAKSPRVMGSGIEIGAYEIVEEVAGPEAGEDKEQRWPFVVAGAAIVIGCGVWMISRRRVAKERKEILQIQEDFEKMQERQQNFASETSHELRTPIAVILSHCELALAENRQPEQIREAVKACQRAGVRMKSLTDDLLEISKMENGVVAFALSPCSLREVAEDALDLVESVADRKGVELIDEVDDLTLMANGDRLWQVMVNLLNNAVRHTPEGKVVRLHAVEVNGEVVLSVIDQGEGIPAEEIPHLFKRFYKGEEGESGLGLAICEMIVKAHGGTLTVESEPGIETRFVVTLPGGG